MIGWEQEGDGCVVTAGRLGLLSGRRGNRSTDLVEQVVNPQVAPDGCSLQTIGSRDRLALPPTRTRRGGGEPAGALVL